MPLGESQKVDKASANGGNLTDVEAFEQAITRLLLLEHRLFASQLECFRLTPAQYHALVYMAKRPDPCTMGCLAEHLHQSSATTTGLVDRLVRRSLAERRTDLGDRRRVMVRITESGVGLLTKAKAARHERTVYILSSLDGSDRQLLCELLAAYAERTATVLREIEKGAQ